MSAEPVPGPDNPFDHDWHRLLRWGDIALALVLLAAPALALCRARSRARPTLAMVALLAWVMVIGSLAVPGVLVLSLAPNEGQAVVPLVIGVPHGRQRWWLRCQRSWPWCTGRGAGSASRSGASTCT